MLVTLAKSLIFYYFWISSRNMKMVVIKNSDSDEQDGYIKLSTMTTLASKQFTNILKVNGLQSSALANM